MVGDVLGVRPQLYRRLGRRELPAVRARSLSLWGYEVLTRLLEAPAHSQLELADALELDKTKVMRVMDELEGAGYATRTSDAGDRRRRVIAVTPAGRRAWQDARTSLADIETQLLQGLPAGGEEFRDGLRRVVEALE